ncbi:MAG: ABC transporter substrate-binding protein [Archaeoglobi archaeon]|nr:ABC transporter substrate-binding protein [Archaeoglobi archaeon]
MRIGYLSTLYHTSHMLRIENVVKAEWRIFGTGVAIINAMERGEIDLAYVGLTPAILGIDRGLDIVCIAGGHVEGTAIVGRECGAFPDCLEGKRVGVPSRGSIHDVILRSYLEHVDFEVVNYPWAEMIFDDFIDGKLDFACGTPNLAVLTMRYGARLAVDMESVWPWNPNYGIVVRRKYLEDNFESIKDFLIKHEWASNILREAPEHSASLLEMYLRGELGRDVVERILRLSPKYCSSLPEEYVRSAISLSREMERLGYISSRLSERDVFDYELVREIHPQPQHYK